MFGLGKKSLREIGPQQLADLVNAGAALVVDVREADEVEQGIIPGAVHIPRGFLEMRAEETLTDKSRPVVVYCAGGVRSVFAAKALEQLGYTEAVSLSGGFGAWKGRGERFVDLSGGRERKLGDRAAGRGVNYGMVVAVLAGAPAAVDEQFQVSFISHDGADRPALMR